jgi:DNA-directed RNA polymerase specialized sigma24 family protein
MDNIYRRMATTLQNISPALIHEAQLGNKDSMNRLAELASERLYAYIYRLTLDQALTQDILQETILFMIQSINQLEHVDNFWGWLFRTAMGKVQHYYRDLQRRKAVSCLKRNSIIFIIASAHTLTTA